MTPAFGSSMCALVAVLMVVAGMTSAAPAAAGRVNNNNNNNNATTTASGREPSWRTTPAGPCDAAQCKLPSCLCASTSVPGGLDPRRIPQMIVLGIDDGVRKADYDSYYKAFFCGRRNPNGCPIGWGFAATSVYTDWSVMETLHTTCGLDILDHTVDHNTSSTSSYAEWQGELNDMRRMAQIWANIGQTSVTGARAPFLQANEAMFQVLYDSGFRFDTTMCSDTPYWPFTLDYKSPLCADPNYCPVNAYPGLWTVPVTNIIQWDGTPCNMLDDCKATTTAANWTRVLMDNFDKLYQGNRAPYVLYAHPAFWEDPIGSAALGAFLDKMASYPDVFMVSQNQLLDWVQTPMTVDQVSKLPSWCQQPGRPRCDYNNPSCFKWYSDANALLATCTAPCPPHYPQLGDPSGK